MKCKNCGHDESEHYIVNIEDVKAGEVPEIECSGKVKSKKYGYIGCNCIRLEIEKPKQEAKK